jgi:uncharacterized phage protein (TIGR01671 family)
MNREILFRGRSFSDGSWVYGDLEYERNKGLLGKVRIHTYKEDGSYDRQHLVESKTVGQFTGLVDKNGVKIFEGDIVRIYDSDYEEYSDQQVKFAHGVFGVDNWTKKTLTTLNFFMGCESEYSVEVIGNIHDNPELLAAKQA